MGYNEVFKVFDNGGETVDRYTVFLADDPESGALGLSDDPTNPSFGFSQFGDFDLDTVSSIHKEIPFDSLPEKVQAHVLDRFGLTETEDNPMMDVVLTTVSGKEQDAKSKLRNIIEGKVRDLMEFRNSALDFRGNDVFVKGKKVGETHIDLDNDEEGIILTLTDGERRSFDTIKELTEFLCDKFRISESVVSKETKLIFEATAKQKAVVKALRQLAAKLQIPKPRFRSSGGRTEFIELSLRDWKEEQLPNDLRKKAVVKVLNAVPMNFANVSFGNIRPESMAMTADQWTQLLSYYGIDVPELMGEGYTVMPGIDRERYGDREYEGLEGPFMLRNGKVVYYDTKEGKYYDPDSDMYLTYDEYEEMNRERIREGVDLTALLKKAAVHTNDGWEEIVDKIPPEYRDEAISKLDVVWEELRPKFTGGKLRRVYRRLHAMEKQLRAG